MTTKPTSQKHPMNYAEVTALRLDGLVPIRVAYKDESCLMRVLGALVWLFNKKFMTSFTTTLGSTVYLPSREWAARRSKKRLAMTIAHEAVHALDAKALSMPLFSFLYLFPQCLAVLALLAPLSWWWLLALLALAPLPAPGRAWLEARAYALSVNMGATPGRAILQFTGWGYYKMLPNTRMATELLNKNLRQINDGAPCAMTRVAEVLRGYSS